MPSGIKAFWELLTEKPYARITTKDVAARAQVNRNSFYYHFTDIPDLARRSISATLPQGFKDLAVNILTTTAPPDPAIYEDPEIKMLFDRVRAITGPHGSNELTDIAKEAVYEAWLEMSGLNANELSIEDDVSIRFVLAGLVDLWGNCEARYQGAVTVPEIIFKSRVVQSDIKAMRELLEEKGRMGM